MAAAARLIPLAAALGVAGIAAAQDEEAPDLDFLEYLGSWQDGDDEWVVVAGIEDGLLGAPAAGNAADAGDGGRQSRGEREAPPAPARDEAEAAEQAEDSDETDED